MSYSIFGFSTVIGSLGIFIFGMKIFSEGLQKIAGSKLKGILSGMTRNRATGVVTGFATTAYHSIFNNHNRHGGQLRQRWFTDVLYSRPV